MRSARHACSIERESERSQCAGKAAVSLVAERPVKVRTFLERSAMSSDKERINLALLDSLQQLQQIVLGWRLRHRAVRL